MAEYHYSIVGLCLNDLGERAVSYLDGVVTLVYRDLCSGAAARENVNRNKVSTTSMKILIAPDKFKGSLPAQAVAAAIAKGIQETYPQAECVLHPLADGGDGSLAILEKVLKLKRVVVGSCDPLDRPISAHYLRNEEAAFIELATASGLVCLTGVERNPLLTSTLGTGLLMKDALDSGLRQIYLFLGGSATNDFGMGIAQALGFLFLDKKEQLLAPTGENLGQVASIKSPELPRNLKIQLLCDVTNPPYGGNGAAQVYAAQKGADESVITRLDTGAQHFCQLLEQTFARSLGNLAGGGAAGGVGAGLYALLNAELQPGFQTISQLTNLEAQVTKADIIISGEGRIDEQSLQGKVIDGLAALCQKHQKPLYLFSGNCTLKSEQLAQYATGSYRILPHSQGIEDAIKNAATYLKEMAARMEF